MILLEIKNLVIQCYCNKQTLTIVDNVNLKVKAGQIVGIVGESGSGKSTLVKSIIALLDKTTVISNGTISFQGEDINHLDSKQMSKLRGKKITFIFQDPFTALNPLLKIRTQMCESIKANLKLNNKQSYKKALELLTELQIPKPEINIEKYPHQLSGGQRQRIIIAIALAAKPHLIIADEPTTALDLNVQERILQTLKKLCKLYNIAIILVTHNMRIIADITDYLYIMQLGKFTEQGKTKSIIANPSTAYTKALLASIPQFHRKTHRLPILDTKCKASNEEKIAMAFLKEQINEQYNSNLPIIKVEKISKYFGSKGNIFYSNTLFKAVDQVSFQIMSGKTLGLIGESGSGKSTVGLIISGLLPASSGIVLYKGVDINDQSNKTATLKRRLEMQIVFQDPFSSLNPRMTIGALLSEALKVHRIITDKTHLRKIIIGLLHRVGLDSKDYDRYPHQFSGGQRQRIAIARALSLRPPFMVVDEPTSALDTCIQAQILNLLKDLQESLKITLLFISHDLTVIRQVSDEIAVMKEGKICEIGNADQIFHNPQNEYTKSLLAAVPGNLVFH